MSVAQSGNPTNEAAGLPCPYPSCGYIQQEPRAYRSLIDHVWQFHFHPQPEGHRQMGSKRCVCGAWLDIEDTYTHFPNYEHMKRHIMEESIVEFLSR